MAEEKAKCTKCKAKFTDKELLTLSIVAGQCPLCGEELE